jgi:ribosome-interacting GTPase 1
VSHQTGFPSVGKSSLLNELTDTESMAAGYEFTTLTCIPGNVYYNDTRIQVWLVVILIYATTAYSRFAHLHRAHR